MQKNLDLRQKKVIDVDTAEKIGFIRDMDIDLESGKILSVRIPRGGLSGIIHDFKGITVSWDEVVAIGSEYILVKFKKKPKISDNC